MRMKAAITTYEDVDVLPSEIVKATIRLFDEKYAANLKGEYINAEGYWMVFDYCHPHNGDDHYKKGLLALPEERQLLNIRCVIENLTKNSE